MYTSFRVQNFRGFDDLRLDDLARVNLIAGKNNTGKTSLLEAILLHSGNVDPDLLMRTPLARRAGLDSRARATSANWSLLFKDFDSSKVIHITADYTHLYKQLTLLEGVPKGLEIVIADLDEDKEATTAIRRSLYTPLRRDEIIGENTKVLKLFYPDTTSYVFQYRRRLAFDKEPLPLFPGIFLPARESIPAEDNASRFSNIRRAKQSEILIEVLSILEPRLSELELLIDGELPLIHGYVGLQEPIPLIIMGEGINRVASLVLAISSVKGGIVVIDEIENGLHYSALRDVWLAIYKAAQEFDVQIFATTHSFECIVAAHQAFTETDSYDFRFHRLDRTKNGEIQAVTYNQETLGTSIEANFEVR